MAKPETNPVKIAVGVCLGMLAAGILLRACDAAIEQARVDEVNKGFREMARQVDQIQEQERRERLRKQEEDEAATERIRAKVAAELARRASQPAAQTDN
jgi:hypothetical protein